ncbi:MAG: pseudouridine synthase, partial [Candidatus Sumerlaeota bacterium]|nr:pseudouridine synthase [Candidatus Sumerlaeota bacterium]
CNPATRSHFARLFLPKASKHLVKEYWAVCEATRVDVPERMRLENHIARSPQAFPRQAVFEDRPANAMCEVERLRWLDEARGPGGDSVRLVLLRVRPLTGRQHQIRVQLSYAGLPILNDRIYGLRPRHDPEDLRDPMRLECRRLAIVDYPSPGGSERLNREWRLSESFWEPWEGDKETAGGEQMDERPRS